MSWMRQRICEGQLAVMLLTRLPAGRLRYDVPKLASAVWFFPSVGIPIGLLVGLSYIGMCYLGFLPTLASILAFSIGLIVTGAMHEDGLADCGLKKFEGDAFISVFDLVKERPVVMSWGESNTYIYKRQ